MYSTQLYFRISPFSKQHMQTSKWNSILILNHGWFDKHQRFFFCWKTPNVISNRKINFSWIKKLNYTMFCNYKRLLFFLASSLSKSFAVKAHRNWSIITETKCYIVQLCLNLDIINILFQLSMTRFVGFKF